MNAAYFHKDKCRVEDSSYYKPAAKAYEEAQKALSEYDRTH